MAKAPLSTSGLRAVWGPPCSSSSATFTFWTGCRVTCDPRVLPALAAMDAIMRRYDYAPTPPDVGMFVCRPITNGTGYSLHAYKIAVDVNWQANPYFPYPAPYAGHCDMPIAMVNEIVGLRTRSGAPVWGWGGYYRSIRDYMHYEIVCTPADLASGIVGTSLAPAPLTDEQKLYWLIWAGEQAKDKPVLGKGMVRHPHRRAVKQLQRALGIAQTGVYGPGTRKAVKQFQAFLRMPVTGIVDERTWQMLIYTVFTKGR